jgi:hypothetical protein
VAAADGRAGNGRLGATDGADPGEDGLALLRPATKVAIREMVSPERCDIDFLNFLALKIDEIRRKKVNQIIGP